MATFIGFNTINQFKKFTLTDFELIKRDLANSFNIAQGSLPGRPGIGTTIWNYIFENLTTPMQQAIRQEVVRMIEQDPQLVVGEINVFAQENGMLIEIQVFTRPDSSPEQLSILFDRQSQTAVLA